MVVQYSVPYVMFAHGNIENYVHFKSSLQVMNLRSPDMDGNESRALMWEKIGVWKSEAPDKIDIKVRLSFQH